jgi:hypothetical protein
MPNFYVSLVQSLVKKIVNASLTKNRWAEFGKNILLKHGHHLWIHIYNLSMPTSYSSLFISYPVICEISKAYLAKNKGAELGRNGLL